MNFRAVLIIIIFVCSNALFGQETTKKATELNEIVIKKEKKAVEKRADHGFALIVKFQTRYRR